MKCMNNPIVYYFMINAIFVLWCSPPPQKRHSYSFDDIVDLPRFEIAVVAAR